MKHLVLCLWASRSTRSTCVPSLIASVCCWFQQAIAVVPSQRLFAEKNSRKNRRGDGAAKYSILLASCLAAHALDRPRTSPGNGASSIAPTARLQVRLSKATHWLRPQQGSFGGTFARSKVSLTCLSIAVPVHSGTPRLTNSRNHWSKDMPSVCRE